MGLVKSAVTIGGIAWVSNSLMKRHHEYKQDKQNSQPQDQRQVQGQANYQAQQIAPPSYYHDPHSGSQGYYSHNTWCNGSCGGACTGTANGYVNRDVPLYKDASEGQGK